MVAFYAMEVLLVSLEWVCKLLRVIQNQKSIKHEKARWLIDSNTPYFQKQETKQTLI